MSDYLYNTSPEFLQRFVQENRAKEQAPDPLDAAACSDGPSYCAACGAWPARETPKGKLCHMCWCQDIAAANPVPLPSDRAMLSDLASIGVPGAAEKLSQNR